MHKIAKAMIAQIALKELNEDFNLFLRELEENLNLTLPVIKVLSIKIPLTFKEAINNLKYGT